MKINFTPTSKFTKGVIVTELLLVLYLMYALTTSVYRSYQIDQHIKSFEIDNQRMAEENAKKLADLEYFMSDRYVEKLAKQNLGLVNPGEEVIIVPKVEVQNVFVEDENVSELSNPERWWLFFFGE